jgi:hypothetical protein
VGRYTPATDKLSLRERGVGWVGSCRRGQPGTLAASTLELDCETTTVSNDGAAGLQVGWRMSVTGTLTKPYNLEFSLRAWDQAQNDTGVVDVGYWGVHPKSHDLDLSQAQATFLGEASKDLASWEVADAGDVNGDGFGDIAIGAPKNEELTLNGGQVYVFFGSESGWTGGLSLADADASFAAESQYDYAGYSVDGAGDVNGDGYDDIIIGAYSNEASGITGGRAYLILGKASGWTMDTSLALADAGFRNEGADYVGWAVDGVGDVNGDTYEDFLIGAWGAKGGVGQSAGVSFLILGKETGWLTDTILFDDADASFVGEAPREWASYSQAGVGDVNGDGYDDFLVGAPENKEAGTSAGQAYLILGKPSGWTMWTSLADADASFLAESAHDAVGMALGVAGDVNNDGYDDFLITAVGSLRESGQAYLILGKATGWTMDTSLASAEGSFVGEMAYDRAGKAVCGLGDVNDDGFDDFAIGAPGSDDGGASAGKVYVILGQGSGWTMGAGLDRAEVAYWGEGQADRAGHSLVGVAGTAGAGSLSLLIGAPGYDDGPAYNAGKAYYVVLRDAPPVP